jgi:septin family protein
MSMMIIVGKTTLLRAILQNYAPDIINTLSRDDAESTCGAATVHIENIGDFLVDTETGPLHFHLYDSPGYGDLINNQASFDMYVNDRQYDS